MQTDFSAEFLNTAEGERANEILRSCVHCGFCNATCPTYQITGDELDGPRGRIYLMRELLATGDNEERAQRHLDRCLTCRACETTCPSGVQYSELLEIARIELGPRRSGLNGLLARLLAWMVPEVERLRHMTRLGRVFRGLLPRRLAKLVPDQVGQGVVSTTGHARQVLLLNGCAQQVSTPETNRNLQALLAKLGIGTLVLEDEGCCGSLDIHAGDETQALARMRANIDRIAPHLAEVEAIISSASGCGLTIKDWGRLLASDDEYAALAAEVSSKVVDVAEFVAGEVGEAGEAGEADEAGGAEKGAFERAVDAHTVAWHAPCTLQHGQRITGVVERLLTTAGYELVPVQDAHLCCGSAGTYSALQPQLADELAMRKVASLTAATPDIIATANVGCQSHLANNSSTPVVHWIELLK